MKILSGILFVLVLLTSFLACHDLEIETNDDTTLRIYRISDFNSNNQEIERQLFHYNNNKLELVERYTGFIPEDSLMSCRTIFSYEKNLVTKSVFKNEAKNWKLHSVYQYTVTNDKIDYKSVSRFAFPSCDACWRYEYYYTGTKITKWIKFIKTTGENWTDFRSGKYEYNNGGLVEYTDYVNYYNTTLKPDYKIVYTVENGQVTKHTEGSYNSKNKWVASRKGEYFYEGNNITKKTCYTWAPTIQKWEQFGEINYFYTSDRSIIEESRSDGSKTKYY